MPEPDQTIWFHDGLGHDEATARLAARLAEFGPLRLIGPAMTARALTPPRLEDGRMVLQLKNGNYIRHAQLRPDQKLTGSKVDGRGSGS